MGILLSEKDYLKTGSEIFEAPLFSPLFNIFFFYQGVSCTYNIIRLNIFRCINSIKYIEVIVIFTMSRVKVCVCKPPRTTYRCSADDAAFASRQLY